MPTAPSALKMERLRGRSIMNKNENVIRKLTNRSFKANKGRNLVAVCAIILTTLMFTTLFVLSQSMSKNMVEMAFRQSGYDAQASFKTITDQQMEQIAAHPDVKEFGQSIVVGLAENESLSGRQVEIRYGNNAYAKHSFAYPTTGRMPETEDEIALDIMALERLGIPQELGQTVTLKWREDYSSDEITESTFTLCGFWEGNTSSYASMAWISEVFAQNASGGAENNTQGNILGMRMAQVNLYSDRNIEMTMDKILSDTGLDGLEYGVNLAYDASMQASVMQESLPMYIGMVLVFVAGYLIIYNIFQISVASDIKFYGKLKTLGTTGKQIKKLLYGQATRLCLIGIPIGLLLGYLLGMVLVPVLVSYTSPSVSASPVIFVGSALFAYLTVLISCLRPARIAGKVSPIEALRYSDSQSGGNRKTKKGRSGASLSGMARANLGRNKKRTTTVICSLTLGLVLLSCFYAKNASFDMDKYLSDLIMSDFQIDDATSGSYISGYDPQGTTISPELLSKVDDLDGLETTGHLYSGETSVAISEQAIQNIQNFYKQPDQPLMEDDSEWMDGYNKTVNTGETDSVIYGADGLVLDVLGQSQYIMAGTFDAEQFVTGGYVMAIGPGVDDFTMTMPTFSVGETVEIEGRTFTVMGIVFPIHPIVGGAGSFSYSTNFIMPAETFRQIWPENTLRKLYFNVNDEGLEAAETMLTEYQQEVDPSMPYSSRQSIAQQYREESRSSAVMGNTVSVVIALVGILNFINSMVTAIISRKREFAMIQSVGMTKRQLRKMLIFEGLDYAGLTLIASYIISALAVGIGVRSSVEGGYATFQFTLLPLMICTPILIAFAVIIPYICFKNLEKQSIVEQLQNTD